VQGISSINPLSNADQFIPFLLAPLAAPEAEISFFSFCFFNMWGGILRRKVLRFKNKVFIFNQ